MLVLPNNKEASNLHWGLFLLLLYCYCVWGGLTKKTYESEGFTCL